jgi:hypothetical protein
VVLVGGGLASQRAAETLRRRGYDGRVRIVGAESDPPYDRPPHSKFLTRLHCLELEILVYRDEAFYFAHMEGWQRGLVAPLTKKYWDGGYAREHDPNFEFESDEVVDDFWSGLDAKRFQERFSLTVDGDLSTGELLKAAMERAQSGAAGSSRLRRRELELPIQEEALQGLFHLESGAQILEGNNIDTYSIEDGDHLGLIIEHQPQAFYSLVPLPDSESVFKAIRSTDGTSPKAADRALRGALLYTDEDIEIATYVRKHFASLSEASGPSLHLYVVEQPESDWREASRYWKGILDERLQREWVTLGWLRTKPYRPEESYKVARSLGVYPDQLPCLVLFDQVADPTKLVFPLLDGSARSFRALFGRLQRLILPGEPTEISFAGIRRDYEEILAFLEAESESHTAEDRAVYTFNGQTVFINKPAGALTLSEFQNSPAESEDQSNE